MQSKHTPDTAGSPGPGADRDLDRVHDDELPAPGSPGVEREARRQARDERRGSRAERPGVMIPNRRKRLPLEAPLMRTVASAGVVGIAVAIAAIMSSRGSAGGVIGFAAAVGPLVLAAGLWASRRL